jgi:hypothetical protein
MVGGELWPVLAKVEDDDGGRRPRPCLLRLQEKPLPRLAHARERQVVAVEVGGELGVEVADLD